MPCGIVQATLTYDINDERMMRANPHQNMRAELLMKNISVHNKATAHGSLLTQAPYLQATPALTSMTCNDLT